MYFGGQSTKAPAHGKSSRLVLCSQVAHGNILQSNEPCRSSLSYVFRVLWNSFSYPRYACITHSQTVLALNPKNIRALTMLFNGAGWILKLPSLRKKHCNGCFQKLQRCQNHRQWLQRGVEKSVNVFWRAVSVAKLAHPATIKGKLPARSNRPRAKFMQASEWKFIYTYNERSRSSL